MKTVRSIGKYELLAELGRGGFATVYRARDPSLDRAVALKVLHAHVADDVAFVRRFHQEARTAAQFNHPHIVTIYEVGEAAGQHYIAMEYLPGKGLDEWLEEVGGPLPVEQVVAIIAQVARALDYVHERGAVHRDVKPSNIIMSPAGDVTLLDFGIVRAADGTQLTTTGELMGTPQYMSPEQAEGQEIDHRSDIYALGVVTYQLCTGKAPFDNVSPLVVLRSHADKAPPLPRALNPDLPGSIEKVLLKALAKRPEERYQSAGDFERALQAAAKQSQPPVPPWVWYVGGMAVLGLVIGFLWLVFGGRATPTQTPDIIVATVTLSMIPSEIPANSPTPTDTSTPTATSSPEPVSGVPPAQASLHDTWHRLADEMVMVHVPGGTFRMGSEAGDSNEQPVHDVTLDAFWLDRTEVTNAQYALCVADGNCDESGYADDAGFNGDEYPVVGVSWHDAQTYCKWAEARLPTEAEWEYAARGAEGYTYPWGNDAPTCDLAQYGACPGKTISVGSFPEGASWCDALNLAGNVWEWVGDRYGDYFSAAQTNPTGPETGEYRVLSGGSWFDDPKFVRCANRSGYDPEFSRFDFGFRCARSSQ